VSDPAPPTFDTIWFLSDYGLTDEFVGVVKGVVRNLAPSVTVIDLTHRVAPHDVRGGSLTLARSMQYLSRGIVLAVVDPGVGSDRRAVVVEVGGDAQPADGADPGPAGFLVGPDNGLLAPAVAMAGGARRAITLDDPEYHLDAPGPTFAGRDIFGPAAAHLCNGVPLTTLGSAIDPLSLLPGLVPLSASSGDSVEAEVLWVDRFGNVQLNVDPDDLPSGDEALVVQVAGRTRTARRVRTYDELGTGQLGVLVDSYGLAALVCRRHSAAQELGIGAGDAVRLAGQAG